MISQTLDGALTATKALSGFAIGARKSVVLTVRGKAGVPAAGVAAVALNVTVSRATRAGGLVVYPTGGKIPGIATHAHGAGQAMIQRLIVPPGTNGRITLLNTSAGSAALSVAVVGYYRSGGYRPLTQSRLITATVGARKQVNVVVAGRRCSGRRCPHRRPQPHGAGYGGRQPPGVPERPHRRPAPRGQSGKRRRHAEDRPGRPDHPGQQLGEGGDHHRRHRGVPALLTPPRRAA